MLCDLKICSHSMRGFSINVLFCFVLITEFSSTSQNQKPIVIFATKPKTKFYNFKVGKHEIMMTVIYQNGMKIISKKTFTLSQSLTERETKRYSCVFIVHEQYYLKASNKIYSYVDMFIPFLYIDQQRFDC